MQTKTFKRVLCTTILLAFLFSQIASTGGNSSLKIRYLGKGRFKIARSGHKVTVNLNEEIAGCKGGMYDRSTKMESKEATKFNIIDETKKGGKIYVVLLVDAVANCNVQGWCGAAEEPSLTLIWLKLNPLLKVEAKNAIVFSDCLTQVALKDFDSTTDDVKKIVKMKQGMLKVEYERGEPLDGWNVQYKGERLIYNTSAPEKGFIISPSN